MGPLGYLIACIKQEKKGEKGHTAVYFPPHLSVWGRGIYRPLSSALADDDDDDDDDEARRDGPQSIGH